METENRTIIARSWGEWGWEVLYNGHRVSVSQDEKGSRDRQWWELHNNVNELKISLKDG